jgi:hypothetical protein
MNPPPRPNDAKPQQSVPSADAQTAAAFANSWNTVGQGSVYTREQFLDWLDPIDPESLEGQSVLEMGFGNGSLLYHMGNLRPARLSGGTTTRALDTSGGCRASTSPTFDVGSSPHRRRRPARSRGLTRRRVIG